MRTTTLHGMLSSLATNYNRRNKGVRLYEIGKVYLPKALPLTELPDERTHFTLGMYGAGDFFDMKGVCRRILRKIRNEEESLTTHRTATRLICILADRQTSAYEGKVVGYLGEVHPIW